MEIRPQAETMLQIHIKSSWISVCCLSIITTLFFGRRSFLEAEQWYWKAIWAKELSPPDRGKREGFQHLVGVSMSPDGTLIASQLLYIKYSSPEWSSRQSRIPTIYTINSADFFFVTVAESVRT